MRHSKMRIPTIIPIAALAVLLGYLALGFARTNAQDPAAPPTGTPGAPAAGAAPVATADGQATAPAPGGRQMQEVVIGRADAPVTIIEYASLTCPHCATFHNEYWPGIRAEYVDTGKARFIFRDYPFDQAALAAGKLAHCAGPMRYHPVLSHMFATQERWAHRGDWLEKLKEQAAAVAIPAEEAQACIEDTALTDQLIARQIEGETRYNIRSTPTFIFNDGAARIDGAQDVRGFRAVIEPLLAAAPAPATPAAPAAPTP